MSFEDTDIDLWYADPLGMWVAVECLPDGIASVRFMEMNNAITRTTLPVSKDLMRYFMGEMVDFSAYHVDLSGYTAFQRDVLCAARTIPYGTCITYSRLAEIIDRPGAIRAVANALGRNNTPIIIPCHRVVSKHGAGGFSCGVDLKIKLLNLESIRQAGPLQVR